MSATHQLLFVSVEPPTQHAMMRQLALYDQFRLAHAGDRAQALRLLDRGQIAVVLVDGPLGDLTEAEFCALARREGCRSPIVVMGSGGDADAVRVLDAGAIDYVTRPIRTNVLLARLRAHVRNFELSEVASIPLGDFILSVPEKRLFDLADGREIPLTGLELDLLKYLRRAGNTAVSQARLLAEVWGYSSGADTHTVQTHVHRLRRKIGESALRPRLIVTDGRGYRLVVGQARTRPAA